MSDDDVEELWRPEFQPGWPDIYPVGLIIARTYVGPRSPANVDPDVEDKVLWALHVSTRHDSPRLAFIGELMVSNPMNYGAVAVVMPFALRDEPAEIRDDDRDAILHQYGMWASGVMYDHAAMALRAAIAGNGIPLDVPYGTPEAELHTSDGEEDDEPEDAPGQA